MIWILIAAVAVSSEPGSTGHSPGAAVGAASSGLGAETNAVVEREFERLITADDAAQAEVDKWIAGSQGARNSTNQAVRAELESRIKSRFEPIQFAYSEFVALHPRHVGARLAFGNFLRDRGDEPGAQAQWEKALEVDPKNAEAHHNLACHYTETGQVKQAFESFSKAIELRPSEPVFYYNFANTLYVMRGPGAAHYKLTEQEVYGKVLLLYSNAVRLDPTNFSYATDLAQSYYAMRPFPAEDALRAWTGTLDRARTQLEREEVFVHQARVKMLAGRLAEARRQLDEVTNASFSTLKANLLRAIASRESENTASDTAPREKKP